MNPARAPRRGSSIHVAIAVEESAWTIVADLDGLARRAVEAALKETGESVPDAAEVSIVLCDDAFIAELNRKWRGIEKPTNVLSFPVEFDAPALGDIVIAYETVAREAAAEGKSLSDHLSHMIVHGFFHLLGFDHEEDDEAEEMEALERRTLAAIGIASPYREAPTPRAMEKPLPR